MRRRQLLGRKPFLAPPPVDLAAERRNGDFVRGLIETGEVAICHDISDGGIAVAVAEMALAGDIGARIEVPAETTVADAWLFGEDQGRYLVQVAPEAAADLVARAGAAGVRARIIGVTGGDALTLGGGRNISLEELRRVHEGWLPGLMEADPSKAE